MTTRRRILLLAILVAIAVLVAGVVTYVALSPRSAGSGPGTVFRAPALCTSGSVGSGNGNWTTYHRSNVRDGYLPGLVVSGATPRWSSPFALDGQVYAEPLACGDAVYVATENNSVYAINSTSGTLLWETHLGPPVPASALPCGDINPSGITGTPVIDVGTGVLYVVAYLVPAHHVLFGLNVRNGSVVSQTSVDPPGAVITAEQERGALALANGIVYVPFGGLAGDCATYHGWVVGVSTAGSGGLLSYQVPTHREGGIWSPAGESIAPNGTIYVATGNGDSTTTFDHGDAVIALTSSLTELGYFAPVNWAQLNRDDTDLGSVAPTVLPNGDLFEIGKAGEGYVLSGSHLGGVGGQLGENPVCGGAYGGTAEVGLTVLVPCNDGLYEVKVNATNLTVGWSVTGFDAGPPIVTGNVVWSVSLSSAHLVGFNLTTGAVLASFPLGSVDHFITPAATPDAVYVAAGTNLYGFSLVG